jgi:hypothetical protein
MRDDNGNGISRRGLIVNGLAAGAAATLMGGAGKVQAATSLYPRRVFRGRVRNVVLVHGAYADGSSWSEVDRTPAGRRGPRDRGAEPADLGGRRRGGNSPHPWAPHAKPDGPRGSLLRRHRDQRGGRRSSCRRSGLCRRAGARRGRGLHGPGQEVPDPARQRGPRVQGRIRESRRACIPARLRQWRQSKAGAALYAVQGHISATLFDDRTTVAAWRTTPSWYAISKRDRTTSPALEHFLARRMKAKTIELNSGHLSLITHPRQITELILRAARHA